MQRQYMRKHNKNMHQGGRHRIHVCPYCSADKARTYSTYLDWKDHLSDIHLHCMEEVDPLLQEYYAVGFKVDQWGRFHKLDGSKTDRAYEGVRTLRKQYGKYQGQREGQPPGLPSPSRLPHTKGTTPDKDTTLMESEPARGRSSRRRATTRGPLEKSGRGRLTRNPKTPSRDVSLRGAPVAGRTLREPWWQGCQEIQDGVLVIGPQGRVRGVQVRQYPGATGARWSARFDQRFPETTPLCKI